MKQAFELTTRAQVERAYLVGVSLPDLPTARAWDHLEELAQLAETAGAAVVGRTVQGRTRIDGATYIGAGKAEELRRECEEVGANLMIFDNDLSPAQARNLEKILKINIIDRTELILDIFARHAKTQQAKIQVELAQLQYALPRLTRLWEHLSRQAGGIGTRGPGETQLEVDRRRIHQRMGALRRQLKRVERRRETLRRSRRGTPTVALVGYTNAGKSTLMRALTGSDAVVRNRLFATLDTMTRRLERGARGNGNANGNGTIARDRDILLVDTVGFIRKLPDHLATSFKATLEDTARASLYLHVVDISHPSFVEQMEVTDRTLRDIDNPGVQTIHVFNKIDRVDQEAVAALRGRYPDAVFVSARAGEGVDRLRDRVEGAFFGRSVRVEVKLSAGDGKGISRVRDLLHDVDDSYRDDMCVLNGAIEVAQMGRLESVDGVEIRYLF